MTELQTRILAAIQLSERLTVATIAFRSGADTQATQKALHDLDDSGQVLMRNGLYRLSAVAVAAREGQEV